MRTTLFILLFLTAAPKPVTIKVSRTVLYPGDSLVVTCSVPRHEDNRKIEGILVDYTSSEHQLNGADSAITHRFEFKKVPEDTDTAACRLTDKYGRQAVDRQTLQVVVQ
jgi:hypothetical protein